MLGMRVADPFAFHIHCPKACQSWTCGWIFESKDQLHSVALHLSTRLSSHSSLAFAALVAAVSGRCASMLRRAWSVDEAFDAMPLLGDLWKAGLLYVPGDTTRRAVGSALATIVSREAPSSRPCSSISTRGDMERLRRWCRSCKLFELVPS